MTRMSYDGVARVRALGNLCPSSRTNRNIYARAGVAPTLMVGGHSANDIYVYEYD